jgi:predicted RNA-binding Zn-ribbon protein involved in translation (DUF1610 family)
MTTHRYIYSNQIPEAYALNVHFDGLSHLYAFARAEEEKILTQHPKHALFWPIDDPGDVILNHFIWYSNSFILFVDLFSRAFALRKKLRREFGAVEKWRNKVSGHFSLVNNGHRKRILCPNCGTLVRRDSTPRNWGWELTDVHERVSVILEEKGFTHDKLRTARPQ